MDGAENSNPESTETSESVDPTKTDKEASDSAAGEIAEGAVATSSGDGAGGTEVAFLAQGAAAEGEA